jgi:phage-related protein
MISIPIISDFDSAGIKRAQREFKQLETVGEKAQFAIKKAAVPAAAALGAVVAVIGDSVKAAIEDEAAQASLARQIKASSGATDSQVASVEKYISSLAKSAAISDDEARPAFQKLIVATKDVTKATELMNLATDVAAATGKPLVDVSEALSKGYAGNMKALGALSPEIKAMIKDGASLADVQAVLTKNFGGAGEAAANTAAGGMKKLGIAFGETKESIGAAFLPIMEKLLPVVQKFAAWAEENPSLLAAVIAGMGILAGSILAVNAAMMLNPAVAITAGILALGAAVIYAYRKFESFREVVRVVVNSIAGYIEGMVNGFIKAINLVIYGINLVKPGKDIDPLKEITLGRMAEPIEAADLGRNGSANIAERNNNVNISVYGGDPNQVVEALRSYMRQNGSVPIKVSNIF